jgi:indole-3-glycerol phosphate synthase
MKDTYLKKILETTRNSVSDKKKNFPLAKLESELGYLESTRGFKDGLINSLEENSIAVIAEMKKASPSQGLIREKYEPEVIAKNYEQANAACLSVLTDEPFFHGSLEHLSLVRACVDLPLLRKDFIIDEYQIYESRYGGADCILLISAALTQNQLHDYHQLAIELNLDVLVEVHTLNEMESALKIGPNLIGINNRNLETLKVNLEITKRLSTEVPEEIVVVSESGIKSCEDVKKIISYGVTTFLVGEVFMRAEHPGNELRNLFFT